jgi:hypothetical protein
MVNQRLLVGAKGGGEVRIRSRVKQRIEASRRSALVMP